MPCHPPSLQEPSLPSPGQLLAKPLTRLEGGNPQLALDVNKVVSGTSRSGWTLAPACRLGPREPRMSCSHLVLCLQLLRLLGDGSLLAWQEQTMGTYLAKQGQREPGLRDELFSQLVAQLWRNPDAQQSQRGWALMAVLLSAFPPLPTLQKPLLKYGAWRAEAPWVGPAGRPAPTATLRCPRRFVSDQAPTGMAALCQHKLLGALEQTQLAPGAIRAHPPTQLEWTAGWRRGRMALDVFTFNGDARLLTRPPRALPPSPRAPASCLSPRDPDLPSVLLLQPAWGQQPLPVRVDPPVPHSWLPPLLPTEERFSAEVESWTTGEQFAGWILWSRYGGLGWGECGQH